MGIFRRGHLTVQSGEGEGRYDPCYSCGGSGYHRNTATYKERCSSCRGSGGHAVSDGGCDDIPFQETWRACSECYGTGEIEQSYEEKNRCDTCKGSGQIWMTGPF